MLGLCRETGCRIHIVHVSAAETLGRLRDARRAGLPVTAETCPHYLTFAAEEILDGATAWKCAPPIRERSNREQLWDGLAQGTLDLVASDHSPAPPALKCLETGDFVRAWGGIASLQLSLSIAWSEAKRRKIAFDKIAALMTTGPATLAGLGHRKGRLAAGYDADIIAFDCDAPFVVQTENVQHRHKVTPYEGETLRGKVRATFVRGQKVWEDDAHIGDPVGQWLTSAI